MEKLKDKIDLKTIIIIILAILIIILLIVVINSNKDKYITLSTSNYSDYISIFTNGTYIDSNGVKKLSVYTKGLSSNYNYENIEITAIVTFKEKNTDKVINETITFKCKVDGSGSGRTNIVLPDYWKNEQASCMVTAVSGKLTLAK